jgi:hypothetical protein
MSSLQKKKMVAASTRVEKPTLTICVLNVTLVSGTGAAETSEGSHRHHELSELAVQVQVKNVTDTTHRPHTTPISGKFPVQFARGVSDNGDLEIDEPEDIGQWDSLLPAQVDSCQFEWKGEDSISDTNTVEILLKAKGEAVARGRVRLKPMYTPYLKPGGIHTQRIYMSSNTRDDAVLLPRPTTADIVARLTLGFYLQVPKVSLGGTAAPKKGGIYASALPPGAGSSKMFEMLLTQQRTSKGGSGKMKGVGSSSTGTMSKSKLRAKIKELSTTGKIKEVTAEEAKKKAEKKKRIATEGELLDLGLRGDQGGRLFKPQRSDAAKYAAKGCNYDFMNNPAADGEFLDRTRAKQRASENALRTQRGEEAYNDILEKKQCDGCGNPQSYDEMINKKVPPPPLSFSFHHSC